LKGREVDFGSGVVEYIVAQRKGPKIRNGFEEAGWERAVRGTRGERWPVAIVVGSERRSRSTTSIGLRGRVSTTRQREPRGRVSGRHAVRESGGAG